VASDADGAPESGSKTPEAGLTLSLRIDNALLLAFTGLIGYLVVLLFDSGYSLYYGLNSEFIKPDPFSFFYVLREALSTIVTLYQRNDFSFFNVVAVLVLVPSAIFLTLLPVKWIDGASYSWKSLVLVILMSCCGAFAVESFFFSPFFVMLGIAVVAVSYWLIFFFLQPHLKKLVAKSTERAAPDDRERMELIRRRFESPTTSSRIKIICAIVIVLSPVYYLGYESARTQRNYFVSTSRPTYVLLKVAGEYLVTAPGIERREKGHQAVLTILAGFKVFKLGDKDAPVFQPREYEGIDTVNHRSRGWRDLITLS
jgi:hypothetical protein